MTIIITDRRCIILMLILNASLKFRNSNNQRSPTIDSVIKSHYRHLKSLYAAIKRTAVRWSIVEAKFSAQRAL